MRAAKRRAAAFQADLSQPDAAAALVQSAAGAFGRLDILINMASVYVQRPFDDADRRRLGRGHRTSICAPRFSARTPRRRTCARRAAAASSTSATGSRRAAGRATPATCRTTSPKPASSRSPKRSRWSSPPTTFWSTPSRRDRSSRRPGTTDEEARAVEEATPLGRWGGEMEIAKAVLRAARQRLHHRRNTADRRRPAREVRREGGKARRGESITAP